MNISARNQLKGKITAIENGAVNGSVTMLLDGGHQINATISMGSIHNLGLQVGKEATAIIKATSVMIATN